MKHSNSTAWKTAMLAMLTVAVLISAPAVAQQTPQFLHDACDRIQDIWQYGSKVIYIIAGVGILVLACFAFAGRFKWSHLFTLSGGVILVATANQLIIWLAGNGSGLGAC